MLEESRRCCAQPCGHMPAHARGEPSNMGEVERVVSFAILLPDARLDFH